MDIILVLNEPEQRTGSEEVMSCFFSFAAQNPRDTGDVEKEVQNRLSLGTVDSGLALCVIVLAVGYSSETKA